MLISIVVPCKNRLLHLKQCVSKLINQSFGDYEVIVVDYTCPQKTIDYVKSINNSKVKCVKIDVGENEWNLASARNKGFLSSSGENVLFVDADTLLNRRFLFETAKQIESGYFISGLNKPPYKVCGCCLIGRNDFISVGGYNEVVEGWGQEDMDIYGRLISKGLKQKYFNLTLIHNLAHTNAIRNMYFDNKTIDETNMKNMELTKEKFISCII